RANDRARDEQAVELWAGTQKRTVTTVARIIGDARAQAPSVTKGITSVSNITAAADGTFAAARVAFLGTTATPFLVLLRASDGAATQYVLGDRIADEAWSPARPLIGYTITLGGQGILGTHQESKPVATVLVHRRAPRAHRAELEMAHSHVRETLRDARPIVGSALCGDHTALDREGRGVAACVAQIGTEYGKALATRFIGLKVREPAVREP